MKNTKITCSAAELKVLVIQKPCKSINFHMTVISLVFRYEIPIYVKYFNTYWRNFIFISYINW